MPELRFTREVLMPPQGPIRHVVILFKENHAFDNYFGTFPGANGATMPHSPNPPTHDPNHTHKGWLNRATGAVRQQFLESDIPVYFAYARQFSLCDNYFTDVAGPSTPNHLMLLAAASPIVDNPSGNPVYDLPSLPASLDAAGLTWGNYGGYAFGLIKALATRHQLPSDQFAKDAAAGKLPAVSWVYAPHAFSEHPPDAPDKGANPPVGNVTNGMEWTVSQVNAINQGGLWPQTAIFITWDDWGGWYDDVSPPQLDEHGLGFRVPLLCVSPFAKSNYVDHTQYEFGSILRLVEMRFNLGSLGRTDARAQAPLNCFDFKHAARPFREIATPLTPAALVRAATNTPPDEQ